MMRVNLSPVRSPPAGWMFDGIVALKHAAEVLGLGDEAEAVAWCESHGVATWVHGRGRSAVRLVNMTGAATASAMDALRLRRRLNRERISRVFGDVIPARFFRLAKQALAQEKPSFVYFIRAGAAGPIKIGIARNPEGRLGELQVGSHEDLMLLATVPGDERLESHLHRHFEEHRIRGEWFRAAEELLALIERARRFKPGGDL